MKEERIKLSERFFKLIRTIMQSRMAEQLAVLLIIFGLSVALCPWVGLQSSLLIIFTVSFCALLVAWLLTRRVWVFPVVIGAAALLFGVLQLLKLSPDLVEPISDIEFKAVLFWRENLQIHCVILILPLAFVLFFLVRRLLSLSMLGVLCTAVVVAQALQHNETTVLVLALLAVGYLILLPAAQFRRIKKTSKDKSVALTTLQLTAIPIALISVLAAVLMVPADTTKWKSQTLLNIVYDCNDLISYYFGHSQPRNDSFKISGLGYYPLSDRLGGPISPGNMHLLSVYTKVPFLLRGAVEDTYSGTGWYDGWRTGRFRYDSLIWRFNRNQTFQPDFPLWKSSGCAELYQKMIYPLQVEVFYNNGWTRGIFVTDRLTSLTPPDRHNIYYNNQSELFSTNFVGFGNSYDFTADMFNRSSKDFSKNMEQLEQKVSGFKDVNWETICNQYLQLPDKLPQTVTDTANEITTGIDSPYLKAVAIEKWLAQNCTYTLTPDIPPKEEDFVAHFLKTREGYCVYYASAMTVLARSAGLPARYITGFAMQKTDIRPDLFYITEKTAHAWSEVYFKGIGWVTFDPLRFDNALELPEEKPIEPTMITGDIPDQYIPQQQQLGPVEINQSQSKSGGSLLITLISILLLICAIYMLFRHLMRLPKRAYKYENLARLIDGEGAQMSFYFKDILKQLEMFNLSLHIGETLTEFVPRCDRRLSLEKHSSMEHISKAYMRWQYGLIQPGRDEIGELAALHENLEERVLQKLGRVTYFFKRVLPVCGEMLKLRQKSKNK